MEVPIHSFDTVSVGIGTALGVIATAVFGYLRFRNAGLTRITLAKMRNEEAFLLNVLTRLREVEKQNMELQRMILEERNEREADNLERDHG